MAITKIDTKLTVVAAIAVFMMSAFGAVIGYYVSHTDKTMDKFADAVIISNTNINNLQTATSVYHAETMTMQADIAEIKAMVDKRGKR